MKKLLIVLATAGFLAASSGSLYANDNFPKPSKSKKVKQHKNGNMVTKKKAVKNNDGSSSVKKTKKSSSY
jgi:hypothetical protein